MLILLWLLLLATPAFAEPNEVDLLKLENLNLKIELMARSFKELVAERDALRTKMNEAENKTKEHKTKEPQR